MIVPTCTIFVEAPQSTNIYINAKSGETYQTFVARAIHQLKDHADLSDKDTPVFSAFFLMNVSKNDKLNYSTTHSSNPTYHITMSGDRSTLPLSNQSEYAQPLIEATATKVRRILFHIQPDPKSYSLQSPATNAVILKRTVYSYSEATKIKDPILNAFFNSENLEKVTVETSRNDNDFLVAYKKHSVNKGWFSSWF